MDIQNEFAGPVLRTNLPSPSVAVGDSFILLLNSFSLLFPISILSHSQKARVLMYSILLMVLRHLL